MQVPAPVCGDGASDARFFHLNLLNCYYALQVLALVWGDGVRDARFLHVNL